MTPPCCDGCPGALGHTDGTVLDTLGYAINVFAEPGFFNDLAGDVRSTWSGTSMR